MTMVVRVSTCELQTAEQATKGNVNELLDYEQCMAYTTLHNIQ